MRHCGSTQGRYTGRLPCTPSVYASTCGAMGQRFISRKLHTLDQPAAIGVPGKDPAKTQIGPNSAFLRNAVWQQFAPQGSQPEQTEAEERNCRA